MLRALVQLFARVAIMLCGKGKVSKEGKEYTSAEAKLAYIKVISEAIDCPGLLKVNTDG